MGKQFSSSPHARSNLLNNIWRLIYFCGLNYLPGNCLDKNYQLKRVRRLKININATCPSCQQDEEDISYQNCKVTKIIYTKLDITCPAPNNSYFSYMDWTDHLWNNK